MASTATTVDRVRYVTGISDYKQMTPATISGGEDAVYSYRMKIAWKDADGWHVVDRKVSPSVTTSRHITAACIALGVD